MSASNSSRPGQYLTVTPAKAGVQGDRHILATLDPSPDLIRGSRRDDERREGRCNLDWSVTFKDSLPIGLL